MKLLSIKNIKIFSLVLLLVISFGFSSFALAAGEFSTKVGDTYTPLAPLPCLPPDTNCNSDGSVSFDTYVTYVFNFLIAAGAVAAVFMITWGGFEYMTSDAISGKEEGLNKIKNAIYGLLLVLCSYLILQTINPKFVRVPPGLVPNANLQPPGNQIASWQDELKNQISQYDAQSAKDKQDVANILNKVSQLSTEGNSIAQQISAITGNSTNNTQDDCASIAYVSNPDPTLVQLCSDWLNNQDQQNQNLTNGKIKIGQSEISTFSGQALKSTGTITNGTIDTTLKNLNDIYNSSIKDAQGSGASGSQLTPLTDAYNQADIQLRQAYIPQIYNEFYNNHNDYVMDEQLSHMVETDVKNITDSTIKQQMITSLGLQIDALNLRYKQENYNKDNVVLVKYKNQLKSVSQ